MTHSPGQHVEVARAMYGVITHDLGTVVDFPTEEHVRVLLDHRTIATVHDVAAVKPLPQAVAYHVGRLVAILGQVDDNDRYAVELELARLAPMRDLIGRARGVHVWVEERAAEVAL